MCLLVEKFNYSSLSRESLDGSRHYVLPDGSRVPSVTTILSKTTPKEKHQALQNWRDRVGHQQAQQITTEAANRGTRMHSYLEHYIKTGAIKDRGNNPFSWPSHAMASSVIKNGLCKVDEFWGVEVSLYFPGIYAGTTDCIGIHGGQLAILDFKQTNKPKKEEWIDDYKLQLAAYAEAHDEVYGTNIEKGVVLMCVKPEKQIYDQDEVIPEPKYQEFVVDATELKKWRKLWWARVEQYYTNFQR